jgi:hypothetical protein
MRWYDDGQRPNAFTAVLGSLSAPRLYMAKLQSAFKFKATDSIGAAGAEDDDFLDDCFVDTGALDLLSNISDRRLILLGRTGAGKSALLTVSGSRKSPGRLKRSWSRR